MKLSERFSAGGSPFDVSSMLLGGAVFMVVRRFSAVETWVARWPGDCIAPSQKGNTASNLNFCIIGGLFIARTFCNGPIVGGCARKMFRCASGCSLLHLMFPENKADATLPRLESMRKPKHETTLQQAVIFSTRRMYSFFSDRRELPSPSRVNVQTIRMFDFSPVGDDGGTWIGRWNWTSASSVP